MRRSGSRRCHLCLLGGLFIQVPCGQDMQGLDLLVEHSERFLATNEINIEKKKKALDTVSFFCMSRAETFE